MAEENPFARLFNRPKMSASFAILEPGEQQAPLQLRLVNADPTNISYDCISYDRSQDFGSTEVSVDGQRLTIPRPLAEALRSLRKPDSPRTLWADLLVGDSVEERSRQAAIMGSVMENSDSCIAWLGEGNDHTSGAFDVLQRLANRWHQACLHSGFPRNMARATAKQFANQYGHVASKPADELQPHSREVWEMVAAMLSSSYFSSVQSIPEIVLAKNVLVSSGNSSLTWEDYVSASRSSPFVMAQMLQLPISEAQKNAMVLINSLDLADLRRTTGETIELFPMIQSARDCSTTDPREIVFSQLPIVTPSKRATDAGRKVPAPVADYTKSVQDVFTDAARYIIHERQDLLLWWNESPPRRRRVRGLPSWAPDFSTGLPDGTVKILPNEQNGMRKCVDDAQTLHVQAHALDKIVHVSEILTASNYRRAILKEFQALPPIPGKSLEDHVDRMWRALILNQAGLGETLRYPAVPSDEMRASFWSVFAEERILELLGCTLEELQTKPELIERVKAHPDASVLAPFTGHSAPFEALLLSNALGRRYFLTEQGRCGMTGIEQLSEGDDAQTEQQAGASNSSRVDFDQLMQDDMARMMLNGFQTYLQARNLQAAEAVAMGVSGEIPGQRAPGARVGDIVVALVGGFQPYILRPPSDRRIEPDESSQRTLESVPKYAFVGECYLHGVMGGEPFQVAGWFTRSWKTDVALVDISIV